MEDKKMKKQETKKKKMVKSKRVDFLVNLLTLIFSINLITCGLFDQSPWVWEIEGEKITLQDVEDAYEGYLFWWSVQFNTTPDELKKRIENIDEVAEQRELEILSQLKKEYFVRGDPERRQAPMFKKLLMMNLQANKTGFTDRDDISKKLDFMNKFFIYNLYMMESVKPNELEVSDAEATAHFDQLRRENPRYASIPLLKGQEMAKRQMLMQRLAVKQDKVFNQILEEYKIKQNPDVDVSEFWKKSEGKTSEEGSESTEDAAAKDEVETTDSKDDKAVETKESE